MTRDSDQQTTTFDLNTPALPDTDTVRRQIDDTITMEVRGRVAAVAGDIVEIEGMTAPLGAAMQILPQSGHRCRARVIGFHGVRPVLAPLEPLRGIAAGDAVRLIGTSMKIHVGAGLCGRIIDAFGQPIDSGPLPDKMMLADADRHPPGSLERPPIDQPLETGVRAIDSMLTCGLGQRLGIFAGSGVGKSTLLGMLARGSSADRIVIGMVGERGREVQEFISRSLGEAGLQRSVLVVATSDKPAAQRVAAAWTATAIAEAFRDRGDDVLLLLDSVTRFAHAQRELGLAAGEPPTTRGYPPSVFNALPRLVERAGRTTSGSITAFYTVLVEGDDNNEPIADSLRGLLDGHLVLSRSLAAESHWPPIDVLESLSRLQPHLVSEPVNAAAAIARKHLAEYRRNADLIAIGAYRSGTDPVVDAAVAMREPLARLLTQRADESSTLGDAQAALVAITKQRPQQPPNANATTAQAAPPAANPATTNDSAVK